MNLSKIAQDNFEEITENPLDKTPWLRQREGELVKIIEAVNRVNDSEDWYVLKTHIFDTLVESLERRLSEEANKQELNHSEIHRLQGQLAWAKRFADFSKLSEVFKLELSSIRKQLSN